MSVRSSDQIGLIIKLKIKILNSWRNITLKCYHINSLLYNYIAWPLNIYHPSRQAIRQQTFARFSRHPSLRARRVMVVLWCEDIQSIIQTCINKILWCSWTKYWLQHNRKMGKFNHRSCSGCVYLICEWKWLVFFFFLRGLNL